jgi:hypothetical protein
LSFKLPTLTGALPGRLGTISHLAIKREISMEERDEQFPLQLGVFDIRTWTLSAPERSTLVFTDKAHRSVALVLDGRAAELTVPLGAFTALESGCAGLR